jgi:predicted PurR-regulated permease PerM
VRKDAVTKKLLFAWVMYFLSGAVLFLIAALFHNSAFSEIMKAFDKYGLVMFFSSGLGMLSLFMILVYGVAAGVFALLFQMMSRILMDAYMSNSDIKVEKK